MNVNKATPNIPVESGFHIIHQQENQCAMLCYINWCKLYYLFLSWCQPHKGTYHINLFPWLIGSESSTPVRILFSVSTQLLHPVI